MNTKALENAARCLPQTRHLRKLSLVCWKAVPPSDFSTLVQGVRKNFSLHKVSFRAWSQESQEHIDVAASAALDPRQLRLVQAYCQRNQQVPSLLLALRCGEKVSAISFFPPVVAAVQPAWRAAPGMYLNGLLAVAVNPNRNGTESFSQQHALSIYLFWLALFLRMSERKRSLVIFATHRPSPV